MKTTSSVVSDCVDLGSICLDTWNKDPSSPTDLKTENHIFLPLELLGHDSFEKVTFQISIQLPNPSSF